MNHMPNVNSKGHLIWNLSSENIFRTHTQQTDFIALTAK